MTDVSDDTPRPDDDSYGVCPTCHRQNGALNVGPQTWWLVCDQHRVKWLAPFADCDPVFETEELRGLNAELLKGYTEVEPVYPSRADEKEGAQ